MSESDDLPADLRSQAHDELTDIGVVLGGVVGAFGEAVEAHKKNWFALANAFLADDATPGGLIRSGLASWIQCFETQRGLGQNICDVLRPASNDPGTKFGATNDMFTFDLDAYAEAGGPFMTPIPGDQIGTTQAREGDALAPFLRFTKSSDGKSVMIGLVGLGGDNPPIPPGSRRMAVVSWSDGKQVVRRLVVATRKPAPPPG
jgi:hypothetical protein